MKKILVYFGTSEGQTAKIAEAIGKALSERGYAIEFVRASKARWNFDPAEYAGAVLGCSVHVGRFSRAFRRGVFAHRGELAKTPLAFFSVCLGVLERDNPATQSAERKIVSDFLAEAGLKPALTAIFPGALKNSEYGWVKRKALHRIARKAGAETSEARDYEYTDWPEVDRFAADFAEELRERESLAAVRRFPEKCYAADRGEPPVNSPRNR